MKKIISMFVLIAFLSISSCSYQTKSDSTTTTSTKVTNSSDSTPNDYDYIVFDSGYKAPDDVDNYVGSYNTKTSYLGISLYLDLTIKSDGSYTLYYEENREDESSSTPYADDSNQILGSYREGSLYSGVIVEEYGKIKLKQKSSLGLKGILSEKGELEKVYTSYVSVDYSEYIENVDFNNSEISFTLPDESQTKITLTKQDRILENTKYSVNQIKSFSKALSSKKEKHNFKSLNEFIQYIFDGELIAVEPSANYEEGFTVSKITAYGLKNLKLLDNQQYQNYFTEDNKQIRPVYVVGAEEGNLALAYDGEYIYKLNNSEGENKAEKIGTPTKYISYAIVK